MIFIIGGAYQGKLDFARTTFALTDADIYSCSGLTIDFSRRCIDRIELFALAHHDPVAYLEAHREQWRDCVFLMRDMFCGVVPIDAESRAWRQRAGQLSQYLSREAVQVSRIFCGLEQRLK